jgi:hypothetical protein
MTTFKISANSENSMSKKQMEKALYHLCDIAGYDYIEIEGQDAQPKAKKGKGGNFFTAKILYIIASALSPELSLYIGIGTTKTQKERGIKGGEEALKDIEPEEIKNPNKTWEIRATDEHPHHPNNPDNWIRGEVFCRILEERDDIDIQSLLNSK